MEVYPGWENPSVGQLNKFEEKLTTTHPSILLSPSASSPYQSYLLSLFPSSATMSPNPPANTCLNILGLDSYGTGLWTVNDREENQKFLTNSESIHMCLLLSEHVCKGTFDICRDPIPAIYFPLACIFNNSCISFDIPYRMVWLPTDRVASKVVMEGEPAKFEHLFSDDNEYAKKIRGGIKDVDDMKFQSITMYLFKELSLGTMSLPDMRIYIHQLRQAGKLQAKFEESWQARQAHKHFREAMGSNNKASRSKPKKQKTQAEPSIKGFDVAFICPVKPKPKGWKKMSMVKKAAHINKEQASKLGDEEMAEGNSASVEADWF
ncbi:hypothetical protein F5146DRAFT_1130979 [Armillaria mellea]|nr:hypothetical protein F5146DRAFT_1130979 [Armillaria mellea]